MKNSIDIKKENQFITAIKKLVRDMRELKTQLANKNKNVSGTFTTTDGKTITVLDGNITSIV